MLPERVLSLFFPLFLALDLAYVFMLVSSPPLSCHGFSSFPNNETLASCMETLGRNNCDDVNIWYYDLTSVHAKKAKFRCCAKQFEEKTGTEEFRDTFPWNSLPFHCHFLFLFWARVSQRLSSIFLEFPFLLYFFILDGEGKLSYSVLFYSISSIVFLPISLSSF